jgi:hypothetical protein
MTRQEFLGRLRDVRDQFDWQLTNGSGPGLQIRAVPRKAPEKLLDPMGALCYAELDTEISPADWSRAGELLGLAAPGELAAAANDRTWAGRGANREPIVYLQNLRRRLEAAVGLGGNGVSDPPQKPHAFERFRMTDLRSVARSPRES